LPSSQLGAGPPAQAPPAQLSDVVHASPSSQASVLLLFTQPAVAEQESVVQELLSSQSRLSHSYKQLVEQPSPSTALPSSQDSGDSTVPFPHPLPIA
jgi:hypothetical protein